MPLLKRRKKYKVTQMEPDAVSWVKQGAVPGDNTLLIQGSGESAGTDVHELLQGYAQRLSETDDAKEQMAITCAMGAELFEAIAPIQQSVPDLATQVAEARAWNGGCDAWWAFQSALWCVESPAECEALIDQLCAFLKAELTAAGDGDGDEPKYMNMPGDGSSVEQGAGDEGADMQNQTAPATAEAPTEEPVTQAVEETPEEGTAAKPVAQADGAIDASQSSDTQTDDTGDNTNPDKRRGEETGTGNFPAGTVQQEASDPLSFLNGIKKPAVTQVAPVTQSGETITLTRTDLAEIVKEAVKQAQSDEVKAAVQQALGRPRPVGSQQGEDTASAARPAVKQSAGLWSNSPFDAIGR